MQGSSPLELTLQTLTPIWTGGVDATADRLHATGLIGSLRWWYEVIVRGLGGWACDPSDNLSSGKCAVSKIYGSTENARAFRLNITSDLRQIPANLGDGLILVPSGRSHSNRKGGWYFGAGLYGNVSLEFVPLKVSNEFTSLNLEAAYLIPLVLAQKWGALGAKPQLGFGVVDLYTKANAVISFDNLVSILPGGSFCENILPNLQHFFFSKLQFEVRGENWWQRSALTQAEKNTKPPQSARNELEELAQLKIVPLAPIFRNWLRYNSNQSWDRNTKLWGIARGDERIAAKINVSSAYCVDTTQNLWEIRVWGWLPGDLRESASAKLYNLLSQSQTWAGLLGGDIAKPVMKVWREFNSPKDTVRPSLSNPQEYLLSLIKD